ncbi:MAG: hypothetical protein QOD84_522 [Acidobacteriaceae bacterium]|jgi:hypothetical protein
MVVKKNTCWRTRAGLCAGLGALLLLASPFTFAKSKKAPQSIEHMTVLHTAAIHASPVGSGAFAAPETDEQPERGLKGSAMSSLGSTRRSNLPIPGKRSSAFGAAASLNSGTLPLPAPVAPSSTVVPWQSAKFIGFDGLSNIDQRTANNGNQFSLEPPDQGLCAGNGFVMETVNDVIRVYDKSGNALTGAEDLNSFFGLAPQIIRKPNPNESIIGPFLSDPRCFYDHQTQRWFVSELEQDNGNNTGATGRNLNLLAVSQTSDPTGAFTVFQYDVTDDGQNGTPSHGGCPCFGDQPLLGADQYGVYQSTNEFGAGFNGAQIYAISKAQLVAAASSSGSSLPVVVHFDASQQLVPFGGQSYTIQPAITAGSHSYEASLNGVEYFLSALQFGNPGFEVFDNRIAVWAITNTKSLSSKSPVLTLSFNIVNTETYGQPDAATQKAGEIPLGASLDEPLEMLETNDDRMNQVTYSNGLLYGAVNSKLMVGGASQTGTAWFAVDPSFHGPTLKGKIAHQGYIAVAGSDVIFPSVGVDADSDGAIVFTLTGPHYFPSVAYAILDKGKVFKVVHVGGAGQDPEDGFTGYPEFGGNGIARWGDYSAATSDGERIWFASEYIPQACSANAPPCREVLFNWGTFIGSVKLQ